MNDQTTRLKRRAATAALLSLLAFFLFLFGAGFGVRLQQAAANPTVDVRSLVVRLQQNTTDGGREATFREVMPPQREISGAAVIDARGKIQVTHPARERCYGRSIATLLDTPYGPPGVLGSPGGPWPHGYLPPGVPAPFPGPYPGPYSAPPPPGGFTAPPMGPGPYGAPAAPEAGVGPWSGEQHSPEPSDLVEFSPSQVEFQMGQLLAVNDSTWGARLRAERLQDESGRYLGQLFYFPRFNRRTYDLAKALLIVPCTLGMVLSLLLYWCLLPWWVYLDARPRTVKAVPLALFVGLTNFLGWLTYLVIRPDVEQRCPVCELPLLADFRLCPRCGYTESTRCAQCGRPSRRDWRFCPYCETPRPDAEIAPTPLARV